MIELKEKMRHLSQEYFEETLTLRRHFHRYPDLSGEEAPTAQFIFDTLCGYGIEPKYFLENTAVTAIIEGRDPSRETVGLRADIDALPIQEDTSLDYRSTHEGVMHACGHDIHAASLLSTGRILHQLKDEWKGRVMLVFQPSEEKYPGGAVRLIQAGALDQPKVHAMLGMHVDPEIETGSIGMMPGRYMAATDEIHINIIGKGGHAALPHTFVNPLIIASHVLIELETFYKKHAPDALSGVLTFGRIIGEGETNIVPDCVSLKGTLRTFDEDFRRLAHTLIPQVVASMSQKLGGDAHTHIKQGYPVLVNNERLTDKVFSFAKDFLGNEHVLTLTPRMTAEDFAFYSHYVPSVFYRLGVQLDEYPCNLHSPFFIANEEALRLSPAIMAWFAVNILENTTDLSLHHKTK
jgi:amidohydrolase